jgi:hypothetical protein
MPLNIDRYQANLDEENRGLRDVVNERVRNNKPDEAIGITLLAIHERLGDMMILLARNY